MSGLEQDDYERVGAARRRDSDAADALAPAQLPAPQRMNPLVPSSPPTNTVDRCQAKVRIDAAPTTRLREVTTNCKSCGLDLMLILYPDGSTRRAGQEDTDSSDDEAVSPTPEQKKVIAAARASITALGARGRTAVVQHLTQAPSPLGSIVWRRHGVHPATIHRTGRSIGTTARRCRDRQGRHEP